MSEPVLVAGALANKPGIGGAAWTRLSFVLGLRRLGFDVVFVEQISPAACTDAAGRPARVAESANAEFFRRVVRRFGLEERAALVDEDTGRTVGMSAGDVLAAAEAAPVIVNLSGHLRWRRVLRAVPRRIFVDLDPGYTQAWHDAGIDVNLPAHDTFFTVGTNVGTSACRVPTDGIRWLPLRQPVVLDEWPAIPATGHPRFTTVGSWRGGFGTVTIDGAVYGAKAREFRWLAPLPLQVDARFEAALDIHPGDARDRRLMESNGWCVIEPHRVAGEPDAFREYVRGSWAECSVAQEVYAKTSSGWIGDRTVRYLATGRPALVQDTGLAATLPVGDGLLTFDSLQEAAAGAREIGRNYEAHATAARELAERWFDSDTVLGDMLDRAGVGGVRP